jgi:hypothetical protein
MRADLERFYREVTRPDGDRMRARGGASSLRRPAPA